MKSNSPITYNCKNFIKRTGITSATICKNCGKEKFMHNNTPTYNWLDWEDGHGTEIN